MRGRRECRVHDAPAASYASGRVEHTSVVTTGSPGSPGIPRAMVYGLFRDLPGVPGFLATVASRIAPANLTPASGCQDHTALPSASCAVVEHAFAHLTQPASIASRAQRP